MRSLREDADEGACGFCGDAARDVIAMNNAIVVMLSVRTVKIQNGEQILLRAADEVVKAAPPNPSCSSPAGTRCGPAVR